MGISVTIQQDLSTYSLSPYAVRFLPHSELHTQELSRYDATTFRWYDFKKYIMKATLKNVI